MSLIQAAIIAFLTCVIAIGVVLGTIALLEAVKNAFGFGHAIAAYALAGWIAITATIYFTSNMEDEKNE